MVNTLIALGALAVIAALTVALVLAAIKNKDLTTRVRNLENDKKQIGAAVETAIESLKPVRGVTDRPPEWTRDRALLALRTLEDILPEFHIVKICKDCNKAKSAGHRFCPACGKPLA